MDRLGLMLTVWLERPVIDKTGLTGYYSYDITWKAPDRADGTRPRGAWERTGSRY